ncbi:PE-PGRS family protein [Streptomyces sp. NPDC047434]|uniref:PE-PGRS family protein n=1 Tax=Streptomyces sp. NPDC047434 TaxID=3155143 RepID=UPI0033DFBAFC
MRRTRGELVALLERAGLEITEERHDSRVPTPAAAWRPVAAYGTLPTEAVRTDRPDLVPALNAAWYRLARDHGVLDDTGEFLLHVEGEPTWTRVRLGPDPDLAGVLGDRPGRPEFVTLSVDGDTLLGVTTEEYEVWLVAVDGLGERREREARAAARETPEQREAAWESLRTSPLRPPKRVWGAWADWLGSNEGASDEALIRLLDLGAVHFLHRDVSATVLDAAIAHPDPSVRGSLAQRRRPLTPGQWTRLVLGEEGSARRALLAECAGERGSLTGDGYARVAADPSPVGRAAAARMPGLPGGLRAALAADPAPVVRAAAVERALPAALAALAADPVAAVRAAACGPAWPHLEPPVREALLADPDPGVRTAARLRRHEDVPMDPAAFEDLAPGLDAVGRCRFAPGVADRLAAHDDPSVRRALAANPHLTDELLDRLAADEDESVRRTVSVRPGLTEERRAACVATLDLDGMRRDVPWVAALHGDPGAMRRIAASCHPLLRGTVARARNLPPDVVARLARDEDRVVRLFLAESCDDAPADMLLEVWHWWDGSLSSPGRPRTHPNFPRTGLLRYAGDPNPRLRRLALDDPVSTPELVERLSRDEAAEVRCRAAEDPRLSPASAVRLLDDGSEAVRCAAARHPALPARVLVRLLRDHTTAPWAAANPALPEAVMHWMTDTAEAGLAQLSGSADSSTPGAS